MSAALVRWPITSRSASATTARMWATTRPIVVIQPVCRRGPAARELAAKPRLLEVGRDDPPDVGVVDGPQSFEGGHPLIRVRDDRDAPAIAKCLTQIPHAGGLAFSRGKR